MASKTELIRIDGPTAPTPQQQSWQMGIVYSVQLANGMIVTSPENFPETPQELQGEPGSAAA